MPVDAAAAARRWDDAERYFGMAREVAAQMSNRLELADLDRLHARMLLDCGGTGDDARAAEMLERALAAYRDFGMPAYAAKPNAYGVRHSPSGVRSLESLVTLGGALRATARTEQDHLHRPGPAVATKIVPTPRSASSR